jgi:hypothetical protein
MCPNEVSKFFNVANLLVVSVCFDGKGLTYSAHNFFHVNSILLIVNYQIPWTSPSATTVRSEARHLGLGQLCCGGDCGRFGIRRVQEARLLPHPLHAPHRRSLGCIGVRNDLDFLDLDVTVAVVSILVALPSHRLRKLIVDSSKEIEAYFGSQSDNL